MGTRRLLQLVVAACACCLLGSGCSVFCPTRSPEMQTSVGRIEVGFPACRSLRVQEHRVRRDEGGRLVVRTVWDNTDDEAVPARIRVHFFGSDGEPQKVDARWVELTFDAEGEQTFQCRSAEPGAVRYVIRVESRSLWGL